MNHDTMKEKIFALYDGELGPEERASVQGHLDACPECRAALAEWKAAAARFFRPVPVPASEAFVRRVMARLDEPSAGASFWGRLREALSPPQWALAGAAALAASVVLWPERPAAPAPEPEAAVLHVVEVMEGVSSEASALDASVEEYFLS